MSSPPPPPSNKEELTPARLAGAHCVLLASPTQPLSAAEVAALHGFVDGGGSLVVFSGEGGPAAAGTNLNDVVAKCGAARRAHSTHARAA